MLCDAYHDSRRRPKPRAKYAISHRDGGPGPATRLCGVHARSFQVDNARRKFPVWVIAPVLEQKGR